MRSKESDIAVAIIELRHTIQNCRRHVLGLYGKCSTHFCKFSVNKKNRPDNDDIEE